MPLITRNTVIPLWHYQCPQCHLGSADTGEYAVADMIYCEVCIEQGEPVRLKRWPVEEDQELRADVLPFERPSNA